MTATDSPGITELTAEQSWELLAAAGYGRLAVVLAGAPDIFPVNVVARHPALYFRTAEGTKLLGAVVGHPVAFECDRVDAVGAWSVVVKGAPREVTHQAELDEVDALGLHAWVPSVKRHVIAIDVDSISGRRFVFGPEPEDDGVHPTD